MLVFGLTKTGCIGFKGDLVYAAQWWHIGAKPPRAQRNNPLHHHHRVPLQFVRRPKQPLVNPARSWPAGALPATFSSKPSTRTPSSPKPPSTKPPMTNSLPSSDPKPPSTKPPITSSLPSSYTKPSSTKPPTSSPCAPSPSSLAIGSPSVIDTSTSVDIAYDHIIASYHSRVLCVEDILRRCCCDMSRTAALAALHMWAEGGLITFDADLPFLQLMSEPP